MLLLALKMLGSAVQVRPCPPFARPLIRRGRVARPRPFRRGPRAHLNTWLRRLRRLVIEVPPSRGHIPAEGEENVPMPRTRKPYPEEFRRQMLALHRSGRSPRSLAREFEPSEPSDSKPGEAECHRRRRAPGPMCGCGNRRRHRIRTLLSVARDPSLVEAPTATSSGECRDLGSASPRARAIRRIVARARQRHPRRRVLGDLIPERAVASIRPLAP